MPIKIKKNNFAFQTFIMKRSTLNAIYLDTLQCNEIYPKENITSFIGKHDTVSDQYVL